MQWCSSKIILGVCICTSIDKFTYSLLDKKAGVHSIVQSCAAIFSFCICISTGFEKSSHDKLTSDIRFLANTQETISHYIMQWRITIAIMCANISTKLDKYTDNGITTRSTFHNSHMQWRSSLIVRRVDI